MSKGLEALNNIKRRWGSKQDIDTIEKELKRLEELDNGAYVSVHINRYNELCDKEDAFDALSKENEKVMKELSKEIEKNRALEIIKVLFKGRARLYERNNGIEQTIDKNGNYHKCNCVVYILEFYSGRIHYEFCLHKDEYDLLKEVFL